MNFSSTTRVFYLILVVSLTAISASIFFQTKQEPCKLCKWQLFFYSAAAVSSVAGIRLPLVKIVRASLHLTLCFGFFVASYHSLIVFGLVEDFCAVTKVGLESASLFFESLDLKTSCKHSIEIASIPLPLLNAAIFFLLTLATFRQSLFS